MCGVKRRLVVTIRFITDVVCSSTYYCVFPLITRIIKLHRTILLEGIEGMGIGNRCNKKKKKLKGSFFVENNKLNLHVRTYTRSLNLHTDFKNSA